MPVRQGIHVSASVAEGVRCALAFAALVLLVRNQAGAIEQGPASTAAWLLCGFPWAATMIAVQSSQFAPSTRLAHWRDCLAPALITLIVGGGSNVRELLTTCSALLVGCLGVGITVYLRKDNKPPEPVKPATPHLPLPPDPTSASQLRDISNISPEALVRPVGPARSTDHVPIEAAAQRESDATMVTASATSHAFTSHGTGASIGSMNDTASAPLSETAEDHLTEEATTLEDSPDESWTRRETEDGVSIEAVVHARFAAGSKLSTVHLPFVPPLPHIPEIECEPLDSGCEVTITPEAVFRHGARLAITRRSANEPASVPIGVVIYTNVDLEVE